MEVTLILQGPTLILDTDLSNPVNEGTIGTGLDFTNSDNSQYLLALLGDFLGGIPSSGQTGSNTNTLDFSNSTNSEYISLFAFLGGIVVLGAPNTDFSTSFDSQYVPLINIFGGIPSSGGSSGNSTNFIQDTNSQYLFVIGGA